MTESTTQPESTSESAVESTADIYDELFPPTEGTADICHAQYVPQNVADMVLYQSAAADARAVIIVDGVIVTGDSAVQDFFSRLDAGDNAQLCIYIFSQGVAMYKEVIRHIGEMGSTYRFFCEPSPDGSDWVREEYTYAIEEITFTDDGCIRSSDESSSDPYYTQVISDYDLFDDYDAMLARYEKYLRIPYIAILEHHDFSDMEDVLDWAVILAQIVEVDTGKDFWTAYPDGEISVSDAMGYINRYFDVPQEVVMRRLKDYLADSGKIRYLGGLGGAYPQLLALSEETDGDTTHIFGRFRSVITWEVDTSQYFIMTMKNMPDGTFRYLSLATITE